MKSKPLILFLFGLLSVIFVSPLIVGLATAATYTNVSAAAAKTMIDTNPALVVLDVRNQIEYDAGHIGNARLIPVWALAGRLSELNQSDTILVYCKAGGRSATASQTLVDNGFTHIYNMFVGVTAWISAGYPVYVNYSSAYAPYSSIQAAINNANDGNTIYVSSGLYHEHLTVNKSMTLIGENKDKTIIDGTGNGTIFDVTANNVSISDFTIQNCGCFCQGYYGFYVEKYHNNINITNNNMAGQPGILGNSIKLDLAQNVLIERNNLTQSLDWCILATNSSNVHVLDNNVAHNFYGVQIENSTGVVLSGNNITNSDFGGVHISRCNNGTFFGNSFSSNSISFSRSNNSLIFHNNFLDNQLQFWTSDSTNLWDNGVEGNYWSNYTGADANLDGIGDTPQVIDATNIDHHPLMGAFGNFITTYGPQVDLISNSTISNLTSSYSIPHTPI